MASDPEGSAAAQPSARLFWLVDLGRHARSHPSRALCTMSGVGQPRTQPERRHHRQSKRQERGKRGAWIDPNGYDAGKKIKGKKRHILFDTHIFLLHTLLHSTDIHTS